MFGAALQELENDHSLPKSEAVVLTLKNLKESTVRIQTSELFKRGYVIFRTGN